MKRLLAVVATLLLLAYPVLVFLSVNQGGGMILAALLFLVLAARAILAPAGSRLLPLAGCALVVLYGVTRQDQVLMWYPVMVNLVMLVTFALTLKRGPSMIERFARLRHPNLPEAARPYLERVTQVWCGFFVINGSLALATVVMGNLQWWAIYNGLISYVLMGALMAGEWLVRPKHEAV